MQYPWWGTGLDAMEVNEVRKGANIKKLQLIKNTERIPTFS
jgi:hypothetical protein